MARPKKNTAEEKPSVDKVIVDQATKDATQRSRTFNGLTSKEWTLLSKNVVNEDDLFNPVWNDLSSPRNEHQKEHGAVFPVKLAERLIMMYSKEGDTVFDPFLGIGSTAIAAHMHGRNAAGIELNPKFFGIANNWIVEECGLFDPGFKYEIYNDDCRNMLKYYPKESIQLTVTSPPYANFIQRSVEDRSKTHKTSIIALENNSTVKQYSQEDNDFGNLPYDEFIDGIKGIFKSNLEITLPGGYSVWVVKDYRDTKNNIPYIPFHSDLARAGEEVGWKYHDLIIWDQTAQRSLVLLGYPSVLYTNQNCSFIVVFRKPK